MAKPRKVISTAWSGELAYVIGLIATDGNLSKDGRHMIFVSKDLQLIKTFKKCLKIDSKVCLKKSGFTPDRKYYYVQFGNVIFYNFLLSLGLSPAKSKTIGNLEIPSQYFFDFLRGSLDGDGSFYSYWDKRWASSFLFYLSFISASLKHLEWLRDSIFRLTGTKGHIDTAGFKKGRAFQLKYAKQEARLILNRMYSSPNIPKLERKYKKIWAALKIDENHNARVL